MSRIMASWIGIRDLGADAQTDPGPVLRFLRHELGQGFQAVFLLNDILPPDQPPSNASSRGNAATRSPAQFLDWLAECSGYDRDKLNLINAAENLHDDLSRIWEFMARELQKLVNLYPGDEFAFLLSPGYPEARTAWHVASQTIFRPHSVKLYKTSKERDVEEVVVPFELSVGQVLKRGEQQRGWVGGRTAALDAILGRSQVIQMAKQQVRRIAPFHSEFRVLLLGERGTGKDLFARALHDGSPRHAKPFVAINCAAVPEALAEAEFFGCLGGAATNVTARPGAVKEADGGTLFLDEIGLMPLIIQGKMLRFLQSGAYRPVGAEREVTADAWVIAATNRNLYQAAAEGRFFPDLLDRLDEFTIHIPPLQHRLEDIPELAAHFLAEWNVTRREGDSSYRDRHFSSSAIAALQEYAWPGNIRDLRKVVRRLALVCEAEEITDADVLADLGRVPLGAQLGGPLDRLDSRGFLTHCAAVIDELLDRYHDGAANLPVERNDDDYDIREDILLPLLCGRALKRRNGVKAAAARDITRKPPEERDAKRPYTTIELQRGKYRDAIERYETWTADGLIDESRAALTRNRDRRDHLTEGGLGE